MLIDIHRHSHSSDRNIRVVRNIFPGDIDQINDSGYYSVGLHPWYIDPETMDYEIDRIKKIASNPQVIAIGEAGIDKAVETDISFQRKAFEAQIAIATKKPLIIHCVRAYDEILHYRKNTSQKIPWIFHWFNASQETADKLIRKNCYLSFGHMLFKENSKAFKVFLQIPLEWVFFETDDAGIEIYEVYTEAARLRSLALNDLERQIEKNFIKCFGFKL
jgi:TatD DNase family protein